jgi:NDP-sugar pyrophosphorylase family protein
MKAMLLCAGYGTRLGDLTRECPKPLLPLGKAPMLGYLLGHLRSQGITEVMVNLHFQADRMRTWLAGSASWGMQVSTVEEPSLLGTAGALRNVASFFAGEEGFLVQYGDILTDQDFGAMIRTHRERGALATLLVHPRARSNSVVQVDGDGWITGFLERPTDEARQGVVSPWVNSGVCVCSTELLDRIPEGRPSDLPRDVYVPMVGSGRLQAVPLGGYRCAVDSPERLAEARSAVAEGRCRVEPVGRLEGEG